MTLSEELIWRGLIKDKTFDDPAWLDTPRTFFLGSDCSSDSLTIGNLAIYMVAKHLRRAGWKTVLLVGGATSLIGDPGGKTEERELKTYQEIEHNVASIKRQVSQLFNGEEFTLVNNRDWFQDMGFLEFLRDAGKHFSMTELIQREFISERMGEGGSGISFAEFSYTLIQGYDFRHLHMHHGVELQIGGSDQWGNLLSGVTLIRKKDGAEAHAFSMPLVINKTTGKKFGKSEAGAVWLDPHKTTETQFYQFWITVDDAGVEDYLKIYTMLPKAEIEEILARHQELVINKTTGKKFGKSEAGAVWLDPHKTTETQFYQFWITVDDAGVEDYLKIYTMLPKAEIEEILARHQENPKARYAQTRLAEEVTRLVHGDEALVIAQKVTAVLVGDTSVADLDDEAAIAIREEIGNAYAHDNASIIDLLLVTGLAASKSDARRLLQGGAVAINGQKVQRDHLEAGDFLNGRLLLRKGKAFKDSALIERS